MLDFRGLQTVRFVRFSRCSEKLMIAVGTVWSEHPNRQTVTVWGSVGLASIDKLLKIFIRDFIQLLKIFNFYMIYWQITDRPFWKNLLHWILVACNVAVFAICPCFSHPALVPLFITAFILSNVSIGIFFSGTLFDSSSRRNFSAAENLIQIVDIFGVTFGDAASALITIVA